jgi:hypothetical protein
MEKKAGDSIPPKDQRNAPCRFWVIETYYPLPNPLPQQSVGWGASTFFYYFGENIWKVLVLQGRKALRPYSTHLR